MGVSYHFLGPKMCAMGGDFGGNFARTVRTPNTIGREFGPFWGHFWHIGGPKTAPLGSFLGSWPSEQPQNQPPTRLQQRFFNPPKCQKSLIFGAKSVILP